ncbi:MAG: hypothetical protein ACC707_12810 [Thiohalomonadales bacterium]
MQQLVNVATAARKLGVTRIQLQELIRSGDLQTFEGQVDIELLKRLFPVEAKSSTTMLEKTKIIRESAYAERIRKTLLSNEEELEKQVKRLQVQLAIEKVKATESMGLMFDFAVQLASLRETATLEEKKVLLELTAWIDRRLNKVSQ